MTTYSKIILTKTAQEAEKPNAADLDYGELAINYRDGSLYFKNNDDQIQLIASEVAIKNASSHSQSRSNPHEVTKADVLLGNVDNTSDLGKPISTLTEQRLTEKADVSTTYTKTEVNNLTSDSTTRAKFAAANGAPSQSGSLTYNEANGTFTYNPPAISSNGLSAVTAGVVSGSGTLNYAGGVFTYTPPNIAEVARASLSVGTEETPDGNGGIEYNNVTGVFKYTPPAALSDQGGITLSSLSVTNDSPLDGDGSLTYDNTSGQFIYDQPTLVGLGGITLSSLSVINDSPLDGDGSLTYDITSGQFIHDQPTLVGLGGITLSSLSVINDSPLDGDGSLTYDNTSGEFIYDQATLVGLGGGTIATQDSDDVLITGGAILASGGAELTGGGVLGYKSVAPGHYVQQLTSEETAVTINSVAGTINCVANSSYSGNSLHPFVVNNTEVAETDVVIVSIQSEDGAGNVLSAAVTETTSGTFTISVINTSNSAVDATVILNFAVIKHINPIPV
jgi:hypothetical protein